MTHPVLRTCVAALMLLSACGGQAATQPASARVGSGGPPSQGNGPAHIANWSYACLSLSGECTAADNVGIGAAWMAAHVDWNEVYYNAADDGTSQALASANARHIVVYLDPNISDYCPMPAGTTVNSPDLPENGVDCASVVANYLHAENGSYAHAFEHQSDGNRLIDHADGLYNGQAQEPFYIGDPDLQNAFHEATLQNRYATDVFEDDGGGSYNCIFDDEDLCGGTYGPAHYAPPLCGDAGGYWCYKYGETAYEWDAAPNPQQAYLNDAIALADASSLPVIGNDGVATDSYDLAWVRSPNVVGAMSENTWGPVTDTASWLARADAILTYHSAGKIVIEEDTDASKLMFEIASHWIVYDPAYSVEFLAEVNTAARSAGSGDMTFPEQAVVPTQPLVATPAASDATAFESAPGMFVREYAVCYADGAPIGACAAVVNTTGSPMTISGLTQTYTRMLVHDTALTWAAGGAPQWTAAPAQVPALGGVILAR